MIKVWGGTEGDGPEEKRVGRVIGTEENEVHPAFRTLPREFERITA